MIAQALEHTGGISSWGILAVASVTLVKAWPMLTKYRLESDASLRKDLLDRLDKVERQTIEERRNCAEDIIAIRKAHAEEIADLRRFYEEELASTRRAHDTEIGKLNERIDNLVAMLKQVGLSAATLLADSRETGAAQ